MRSATCAATERTVTFMPRRPSFKPFKRGGVYHIYSPLDGGVLSLQTSDLQEAEGKAFSHHEAYKAQWSKDGKMPKTKATAPKSRTAPVKQPSAESMVSKWIQSTPSSAPIASEPSFSGPTSPSPSFLTSDPSPPKSSVESSTSLTKSSGDSASTQSRVGELLPDDKRRRLANLCARGAARISVLLVGVSVRVFGRVPSPDVDPEERAVLQEGLALWMDEIFVDHPPRPWMVVGGAAVGIGIGMYVDGTPIKREPTVKPPENPIPSDIA